MSDQIEPIIHKMTEAMPEPVENVVHPEPEKPGDNPIDVDMKQHNANVHPDHRERLVDIGRAHNTVGRGGHG